MYLVCVRLNVKPDKVDSFIELTTFNAKNSRKEPGNVRFDVLRGSDNPTLFGLYEVYMDENGFKAHQETPHYARWKAEIGDLLTEPRTSEKFMNIFPEPWE